MAVLILDCAEYTAEIINGSWVTCFIYRKAKGLCLDYLKSFTFILFSLQSSQHCKHSLLSFFIFVYMKVFIYLYIYFCEHFCETRTPAMIGCSFVVDREYFGEIGLLDPGMEVYGGENIELGMRVSSPVINLSLQTLVPLEVCLWRFTVHQRKKAQDKGGDLWNYCIAGCWRLKRVNALECLEGQQTAV